MKASVITFGCKVNQYESQEIMSALHLAGFELTQNRKGADLYVINSCTVTGESSRKVRQKLRSLRKDNPDACIVLTGCYTQAFPEETAALQDADIIIGNKNNGQIVKKVTGYFEKRNRCVDVTPHDRHDLYSGGIIMEFEGHTRAFVKIQDGCNRYCTYCIIPKSRGFSRSKPVADIEKEVKTLAEKGFKEIVFVGINLSSYGRDIGLDLCDALSVAQNTNGIERIRLGSLEPDHITDDIIEKLKKMSKFCPQFHLSLQSGDDGILKRMNRHYTTGEYTELTEKLKKAFPDLSLTTDIIAGFPGESEEAFANSVEYISQVGFMKVHAFPFSPREGTPAWSYPDKVNNTVKAQRVERLLERAETTRNEYMLSYIGKTLPVLFETPKDGYQTGYTKNYLPVFVKTDRELKGEILDVVLTGIDGENCIGELV